MPGGGDGAQQRILALIHPPVAPQAIFFAPIGHELPHAARPA